MKTLLKSMLIVASLSLTMAACDDDDDSNNTNNNNVTCVDVDGDGYGTNCALGPDCDDNDNTIHENCPNCVDNDGDGYGEGCANGPDCDDNDDTIHENCPNCVDNDGDGYGAGCANGPDCDDNDDTIHENCPNCVDNDGDGYGAGCALGPDCDDNDDTIHENCTTCVDNDGDGYGEGCALGPDCDDNDDTIHENCNANCGDNVIDTGETCDGTATFTRTCLDEGFDDGVLACNATCDGYDTTGCFNNTTGCGNNTIDGTEVCDGDDLDGSTCADYGYNNGVLYCDTDCGNFNIQGCYNSITTCGNNLTEPGEGCDGTDVPSCGSYGMGTGLVTCNADCTIDVSNCSGDLCTNEDWYQDGWCDPCSAYGGVEDSVDCSSVCYAADGICRSYYDGLLGMTTCMYYEGVEDPDCVGTCGDGIITVLEQCDGTELNGVTCESNGFASGTIGCSDNCTLDFTNCVPFQCGDGLLNGFESCDGTELNGATCTSINLGFVGGTLACNGDCSWDLGGCQAPVCGDAVIEGLETCDGTNLNSNDCTTLGMGFVGGTLSCGTNCRMDTSACIAPVCGDGNVEGNEQCDGTDMGGLDCTTVGGSYTGGTLGCDADCTYDYSACTGATWTCSASWLGDTECDCGCGIIDTDCVDGTTNSCIYNNCTTGTPDPDYNWICID
ncbi:hypothetical protein KKF34_18615 [Myxococcota bacterium]|nr:hypothetical protein [Myxococcota bacterium]MBU1381422.1 hypothetical protein [Myxococcota bacterium]MBU1498899.1 hypothetical protein [Myxococcota bacterium]